MPVTPRGRKSLIILIVIIIVCVTLVTLYVREGDSGPLHKIQNFFVDLISPVTSVFAKIFRPIKDGFVNLFHLPSLSREKKDLEKEVATLKRESIELTELEAEVEELKALLNWTEERPEYDTVAARITAQSPDNWQRLMILNKGSSQGVQKYMSVVNDEGLVGRIISVGSRSSVVQLITDSRSGVGARDLESRETGIVEGRNEDTIRFVSMNDEAVLKEGDVMVTSGLGGTCPPGIPIGNISEIQKRSKGLTRLVEVDPFVEFSKLDNVLIIVTPEPESIILKETK